MSTADAALELETLFREVLAPVPQTPRIRDGSPAEADVARRLLARPAWQPSEFVAAAQLIATLGLAAGAFDQAREPERPALKAFTETSGARGVWSLAIAIAEQQPPVPDYPGAAAALSADVVRYTPGNTDPRAL